MDIFKIIIGVLQLIFQLFFIIGVFRVWRSRAVANRVISQTTFYSENEEYISAATFYTTIEKHLSDRQIKGLDFDRVALKEKTAFEGSRRYMVLRKRNVIYYINTFSLGNTQIFSYFQVEPFAFWRRVWNYIPILGKIILALFFPKSLYKMDEGAGMNGIIQHDLKAALDELLGEDSYYLNGTLKGKEVHKIFFG